MPSYQREPPRIIVPGVLFRANGCDAPRSDRDGLSMEYFLDSHRHSLAGPDCDTASGRILRRRMGGTWYLVLEKIAPGRSTRRKHWTQTPPDEIHAVTLVTEMYEPEQNSAAPVDAASYSSLPDAAPTAPQESPHTSPEAECPISPTTSNEPPPPPPQHTTDDAAVASSCPAA